MNFEQIFTFIGVLTALILGVLNWWDKRKPRTILTPLESGQLSESLNKAIELANKRALDAEVKSAQVEVLYENLKKEFDEWIEQQNYRIIFNVTLGKKPKIEEAHILHASDRRVTLSEDKYTGKERRK